MKKIISVIFAALLAIPVFCKASSAAAPPKKDGVVFSGSVSSGKRIALTFDDGPHPTKTKEILDILDKYDVKATFFIIGVNAERYPEIIADEAARGHELANHSYSHKNLSKICDDKIKEEIEKGVQTIQYQLVTLMTTNGQAPFITIFMYLNEAKNNQEKADLAMLIEEILRQRIQGVKNEEGVYIAPAFPKLIYVLEEDNITEDSKYWYLTELAAKCTSKRLVPDYISEKMMLELKGDVYTCMGCVDGKELITYKIKNNLYVESFERMWRRLSDSFEIKHQYSEDNPNLYMDLSEVITICQEIMMSMFHHRRFASLD